MLLAIGLSVLVIIGWQYFVGMPQLEKQRQQQQVQQQQAQQQTQTAPSATPQPGAEQSGTTPQVPGQGNGRWRQPDPRSRARRLAARLNRHPHHQGLGLAEGRPARRHCAGQVPRDSQSELTADRAAGAIRQPASVLCAFGWTNASGAKTKLPDDNTVWTQDGRGTLASAPVTLTYDNGEGLEFRRTIAVDENYLFTLNDTVVNRGSEPVTLYPYALISRHGKPEILGYYILHEGLIGVLGDKVRKRFPTARSNPEKQITFNNITSAWLGITDKYWAATLLPETDAKLTANFSARDLNNRKVYQTDYLLEPITVAGRRHRRREGPPVCRRQGSVAGRPNMTRR